MAHFGVSITSKFTSSLLNVIIKFKIKIKNKKNLELWAHLKAHLIALVWATSYLLRMQLPKEKGAIHFHIHISYNKEQ